MPCELTLPQFTTSAINSQNPLFAGAGRFQPRAITVRNRSAFVSSYHATWPPFFREPTAPDGWLVPAALLALCLLPRMVMAWKIPGICPDGVHYIGLGKAFEAGNFEQALGSIRFNIYPLILAGLHRAGLGWETAGIAWGVVISSCAVLPLYGWIRRTADQATALGGCFLYAVHPGLVRWSIEIIRDSTFWFLLALSIYLLWRAVHELRWRWYLAAGAAIALACLTRFEGLARLVLLAAWSLGRSGVGVRRRLIVGGLVAASIYPLTLLLASGLWYHSAATGLLRTKPVELARDWAQESITGRREAENLARPDLPPPLPAGKMAGRFVTGFYKGLSPLYLLLAGCGAVAAWPLVRRPEYRALAYAAGPILLAIWVHLYWSLEAGPRYFFPLVIMAAPLAGCGLRWTSFALTDLLGRYAPRLSLLGRPVPLATIVVVQMFFAFSGDNHYRAAALELGQWVHQR
jgi:4-amino-4-deoxy-L-arabinose transferase-like glycosyltransferase